MYDSENGQKAINISKSENIYSSSATVTDLVPNTMWTFNVAAHSPGGIGENSSSVVGKTLPDSDERDLL